MDIQMRQKQVFHAACAGAMFFLFVLTGCTTTSTNPDLKSIQKYPVKERTCLERAMYFESNRSSREGMISVGTVVMNRVNSSAYPNTICEVVGQKNQFAPGVLTKEMTEQRSLKLAHEAADSVLRGERSPKAKNAMFFHTAGLSFPYKNMHYVEVAGGNAFYEKRNRDGSLQVPVRDSIYDVAYAFRQEAPQTDAFESSLTSFEYSHLTGAASEQKIVPIPIFSAKISQEQID